MFFYQMLHSSCISGTPGSVLSLKTDINSVRITSNYVASSLSSCPAGTTVRDEICPLSQLLSIVPDPVTFVSSQMFPSAAIVKSCSVIQDFYEKEFATLSPNANPNDQVSLFSWIINFYLPGIGNPTTSYPTAGINLIFI